jgi:hypothetical protein
MVCSVMLVLLLADPAGSLADARLEHGSTAACRAKG